jgi:hypothetical protein
MNERIRELAVQADNYAYKMNPEEDSYGRPANLRKFQQDRDTKFSELIVAEFSKQVQIEGRFRLEREQTLIRLCCENAKKHFGVKE